MTNGKIYTALINLILSAGVAKYWSLHALVNIKLQVLLCVLVEYFRGLIGTLAKSKSNFFLVAWMVFQLLVCYQILGVIEFILIQN